MAPDRPASSHTFFVCAISILILFAPALALSEERAPLPDSDRYAVLAYVQAMHQGRYSRSGPSIKVFEVGGGDPAMNGSFIYLRIDHNDRSFVWKTGLNVRGVKRMSFGPGDAIVLLVNEDFMDSKAAIKSRKATYEIRFHLVGDVLQDMVTIENATETTGKNN